jgi:glutathione S-transferase
MEILMLKIWGRVTSANVQKVLWVLDDLGLDYVREDAGLQFTVNKSESFLSKNPNGRIPLLEDGDFRLWESHSICRYLCNRSISDQKTMQVALALYPTVAQDRGLIDQWMDWILWGISAPMVVVFQQLIRTPPAQRNLQKLKDSENECAGYFVILDNFFKRHSWLSGRRPTLSDICLAPIIYRATALGVVDQDLYPALFRWFELIQKEKGYQKWVAIPLS